MTEQAIRTLVDQDLTQVIVWAEDELRLRAEKRKHDTIAKIRELAGTVGLSIAINSKRGRPPKAKTEGMANKAMK
jgi:hypothetical protein